MRFDTGSKANSEKPYPCHLTKYLINEEHPKWQTQTSKRSSALYSTEELTKGLKTKLNEVYLVKKTADFNSYKAHYRSYTQEEVPNKKQQDQ